MEEHEVQIPQVVIRGTAINTPPQTEDEEGGD